MTELSYKPLILAGAAPEIVVSRSSLKQSWNLRRLIAVVEELIDWDPKARAIFSSVSMAGTV